MSVPPSLAVIGNLSIDTVRYPHGRQQDLLGGAALYITLAAARAGMNAAPVTVIGEDLNHLDTDPRLDDLNRTWMRTVNGPSCSFEINYNTAGSVIGLTSSFGVARLLTDHAISALASAKYDQWHVCCRRPLDTARILGSLVAAGAPFSVDFHLASAAEQITAAASSLPYAAAVFVNAAEYQVLSTIMARTVGDVPGRALKAVIVSDGPREATLIRNGEVVARHSPKRGPVIEVTGAGDTLTGTFLAHLAHGAADHEALANAVASASAKTRTEGLRSRP